MDVNKIPPFWSFFQECMKEYLAIKTDEGRGRVLHASITYFFTKMEGGKPEMFSFDDVFEGLAYAKSVRDIDRSYDKFRENQKTGYQNKIKGLSVKGTASAHDPASDQERDPVSDHSSDQSRPAPEQLSDHDPDQEQRASFEDRKRYYQSLAMEKERERITNA